MTMTREEFGQLLGLEIDLIPEGKHNRPGIIIRPASVTVHNTSNTDVGADAHAHAKYLRETGYYVYHGQRIWTSWHYSVDDKRVVNHLPLDEMGYHAHSQANGSSIGIEICMNSGIDQAAANQRAARLVATLLYDFQFNRTAIKAHYNWTSKKCPELLLNDGVPGSRWEGQGRCRFRIQSDRSPAWRSDPADANAGRGPGRS
jgi:N-acetylmuramoyl-L-alanine amidase